MTLRSPHPDLRLQHLDAVDSTNRVAADAARSGAADGLVVVADEQTAGRGRQGRRWVAPAACGLTVSFLRRPRVDAADAWIWTLLAGLAAHAVAPGGAWLKWPNDLMIGERKAGGVLCELVTTGMRLDAIVVGVGLNLVDPPGGWPDAIAARATSLAALDPALAARQTVLDRLAAALLDFEATRAIAGTPTILRAAEQAMGPMIGRTVTVDGQTAQVLGIGHNGALRLTGAEGPFTVLAGDVHLGG